MKTLLVEDNPADIRLIRELLKEATSLNFELHQVTRLDEALDRLGQEAFEVVLLDLGLPDSQGIETLSLVHKTRGGVPIVVLTGLDDERFASEVVRSGAQDYLVKGSFDGQLLVRTIRYAVNRKQAEEEVRRLNAELEFRVAERTAQLQKTNGELINEIVERKRVEKALGESHAKLQSIIDSAMDAVISVDEQERIVVFNRAAETVFQCAVSEALGSSLDRFIPKTLRDIHHEHIKRFGNEGITQRSMTSPAILTGVRANGEEFPIEATMSQVQADGHKLFTVILRDITERNRSEQALLRSEKLASVGRMAASIAHEINNPLAAVVNTLYLARLSAGDADTVLRFLDMADDELKRIAHITRQTLGFYRESSKPTAVSVNSIMDSAVELLSGKIKSKRAIVERQYRGDYEILAVAGELRQVFSNLLANSLDAIDEDGGIILRVSKSSMANNGHSHIRVTVADKGKGIDTATLPHIFEPLFTTKEATGSGLGLWVSKQLIEKCRGSIRVRSSIKRSNRGTVISVVLPFAT